MSRYNRRLDKLEQALQGGKPCPSCGRRGYVQPLAIVRVFPDGTRQDEPGHGTTEEPCPTCSRGRINVVEIVVPPLRVDDPNI